ncbi:MAG: hypothetical protein DCC43_01005 [Candidatus Brocadia sp.]|nr:hypothetical protein [Candidatus Brocadia fulgida]MCC6324454.1 hypothetical protein [Candidatus Brocadia sp.]MCE7910350.1 hypothetical protein [Candidatus Brocadia sp. AMX3]MDG5997179.1 hypothetical protein [Candidatus Brocadia sp.]RIK03159.1 MAG: hypothetical protein DCC43_01005 [Candidatus Brocadia sp.]
MGVNSAVKGTLVSFLVGITELNIDTSEIVDIKKGKSSPSYPDVIPKQMVVKVEKRTLESREVNFLVKFCPPGIIIVEASVDLEDILGVHVFDIKRSLLIECRTILWEYHCDPYFDEEYSVHCVSDYRGDPENIISEHEESIAGLLKTERIPLDEEEIHATLKFNIKYSKDDITIVEWDGAFVFDPRGDFASNIELFEIANLQLLKLRVLEHELENRLEKAARLLQETTLRRIPWLSSREIRYSMREIIQIRTESILEFAATERNINLIGDWYSARLFDLTTKKLHLEAWRTNINQTLDALEDIYSMISEKFSMSFSTTLEFIIAFGWFALLVGYFLLFFLELVYKK